MSMLENFTYPTDKIWTVYTKSNCEYCIKVKKLLESNGIEYISLNCDNYIQDNKSKELFLEQIKSIIGNKQIYKTFPMVFNGKKFIGGFVDTEKYLIEINSNNVLVFQEDF